MRRCKWNQNHEMDDYKDWPWPLCKECEQKVKNWAWELVSDDKPVTYPAFGPIVPPEILHQGGFWQYDIKRTLEDHHNWVRHKRHDRESWGDCGFLGTDTHFHPPQHS